MTPPHGSWPPSPKLLAAYFDGECEGRDDLSQLKQQIEAWLAVCPRAEEELAEYRHLLQTWQDTSPAEPDSAQWSAVLAQIQAQTSHHPATLTTKERGHSVRNWVAATVAAACLAVVILWRPSPDVPQVLPSPLAVVQVEDEVLPVADVLEVVIVRVEGADAETLVVGQLPVQGMLELAAPGDVVLTRISPDALDSTVPQVHMNESSTPLIWAKLDSELD